MSNRFPKMLYPYHGASRTTCSLVSLFYGVYRSKGVGKFLRCEWVIKSTFGKKEDRLLFNSTRDLVNMTVDGSLQNYIVSPVK